MLSDLEDHERSDILFNIHVQHTQAGMTIRYRYIPQHDTKISHN